MKKYSALRKTPEYSTEHPQAQPAEQCGEEVNMAEAGRSHADDASHVDDGLEIDDIEIVITECRTNSEINLNRHEIADDQASIICTIRDEMKKLESQMKNKLEYSIKENIAAQIEPFKHLMTRQVNPDNTGDCSNSNIEK